MSGKLSKAGLHILQPRRRAFQGLRRPTERPLPANDGERFGGRGPPREMEDGVNLALFESNQLPIMPGYDWAVTTGDATEWLEDVGSETVDLIVTDPAYSSLEKHRAKGTTTRLSKSKASSNAWFSVVPNSYFPEWFAQCFRILKPNTHLYVMCDQETMFAIKPMGEEAGFKFIKPIVWDKLKMGLGYHYRARYEFILFFEKGKRRLNSLGVADVLEFEDDSPDILKVPRVSGGTFYPTEKPVGLMQTLISMSSAEGEIVLDPFCGSGSAGEAALRLGRRFSGCDLSGDATALTVARMKAVMAELGGAT